MEYILESHEERERRMMVARQTAELLRHALGLDTSTPTMVSYYYRDKYPELYEEVSTQ